MSTSTILIPVAPGELIDKLTILDIKLKKISDEAKLANISREYNELAAVAQRGLNLSKLETLQRELLNVNKRLWDVEDALRIAENEENFGDEFVALARSVYKLNDERAAIKREISTICGAEFLEEKSYG